MESVRLDKWLWAARFFKSRSLSREAVEGGRVHLNEARVKPARAVQAGDRLTITRGHERFEIEVLAVAEKRGPARVAQALYQETEASREAREADAEQRRIERLTAPRSSGRPDKRQRRQLQKLKG